MEGGVSNFNYVLLRLNLTNACKNQVMTLAFMIHPESVTDSHIAFNLCK